MVGTLTSDISTIQDDINNLQNNNNTEAINSLTTSLNEIKTKFDSIYTILHNRGSLSSIRRATNFGRINDIDAFVTDHGISTGKFTNIYLGDHFSIPYDNKSINCIVAGINSFNSYSVTKNHIVVIVTDILLDGVAMYSTSTATGGFVGSNVYKTALPSINTKLEATLGTHLLSSQETLSSALDSNGKVVSTQQCTCKAMLLSERELYGTTKFTQEGDIASFDQLPLFKILPDETGTYMYCWLRNVVDKQHFIQGYDFWPIKQAINSTYSAIKIRFLIG